MTAMLESLRNHWDLVTFCALVLIQLLNAATRHWSNHAGVVKVILFLSEVLSVLRSIDVKGGALGRLKLPLTSVGPDGKPDNASGLGVVAILLGLFLLASCGWTPQQTTTVAKASSIALCGVMLTSCAYLQDEAKRAVCLEHGRATCQILTYTEAGLEAALASSKPAESSDGGGPR